MRKVASPDSFIERDITLGDGDRQVAGTLTLPRGAGPHPGVVLLSGGAPFDRDETSGPNKPLRDLAWGLAEQGVAVVRFDKVTYNRLELYQRPDFTPTQEYVPHAVAAVRLLRDEETVDPARVFVAGHSMGGKFAPRVAATEPAVAGLVLLAADAEPMQRAAVRVFRYFAEKGLLGVTEDAVAAVERQAAMVESPDLSPSTPPAELPFGYSGGYWLDLREYDQVSTAAALDRPMLVLQGERDYQITVDTDLALWRKGLAHRDNVTFRVYPADDHCFYPGEGPSTPAGYEVPQHFDPAVIADIAHWLRTGEL
ncbi:MULTISPECIES: S9 family peptidase [unclassified Nocardia]|uniref:alpha/beta hydrolase family protein n=1 Tax=unclassified Nocardia TaxID=2637762 RepID=UPI001CE45741|nr:MULTISPECIES: alpha/beta fold hydrolase [unclassified Nocardia]